MQTICFAALCEGLDVGESLIQGIVEIYRPYELINPGRRNIDGKYITVAYSFLSEKYIRYTLDLI